MPTPDRTDLEALLEALVQADVEFVVIGGVAAVIHGAPITTLDLDIVYQRDPENLERLLALLDRIGARVRDSAGRDLPVKLSHLKAGGQLLLSTVLGPFDVMGKLHDGRTFEDLLPLTEVVDQEELSVRVLNLQTLIEVKAAADRAKDRLVLPILLALLEE